MKLSVQIFLASVLLLLFILIKSTVCIQQQEQIIDVKQGIGPGGFWNIKKEWKPHWVKHWEVRKIYVPIWRKVWGPVEVKEWIPFPQPPPEWTTEQHRH